EAPTPVTVGSTDLANVELRIPATKQVTGKITLRGNVAMPRLVFSLASGLTPPSPNAGALTIVQGVVTSLAPGAVSIPTNVNPDGSFTVTLPERERSSSIVPNSIPAGYSVDAFMYVPVDLLKNPIRVASTDTASIAIIVDATTV